MLNPVFISLADTNAEVEEDGDDDDEEDGDDDDDEDGDDDDEEDGDDDDEEDGDDDEEDESPPVQVSKRGKPNKNKQTQFQLH